MSTGVPYYSLEELLEQRDHALVILDAAQVHEKPTEAAHWASVVAAVEYEIGIAADVAADEFESRNSHPTARPFDQDVD
jgi:hypothetical protein